MYELYKEIHTYLNMDEEIGFETFDDFYKRVIEHYNEHADEFEEEDIWRALFIAENVMSNADGRRKEAKGPKEKKKYQKMHKRLKLWAENFAIRLAQKGYTKDQMNERFESMFEEEVH
ncbi:hypothetical protein [Salisediminibacterium halotolerans]|uniref:Uncharacterized protein n=1 Tax=Salisediminibacterium halotolerans TaxID=517425 RepID=A0A1H9PEP0_9BACI|nr:MULTISPECIES: hypothetical protein [Salisediminibacterium]RLJ78054.1 hypothetical protein BCL39_0519 [Actinophytocola xinjiangensis]RPE88608.1 hypothetical protein EDD67_0940 [Salisediminibacterium halotolerans]TWG37031.1 hypothetical protein BCL52_0518 [Salisediminibacterium halotolerans]SER46375.1 hypothetical protein SAMN05444126_101176 [Salisediminibacterium haloalkalitolerans]GEL08295.1 hypothetical protein SHA02_17110 [Salisediminibacterium halotolerans]